MPPSQSAPRLDEYIPIDENLQPAPDITNDDLGEVYNYYNPQN